METLKGKTAIVTGGASGIGEAISRKFATHGAHVHILDRNGDGGAALVDDLKKSNFRASFHECEVSQQKEVVQIIDAIAAVHSLGVLINNAGVAHVGNVESTSEEDLDRLFNINVKGVYNCLHAVIPHMKRNKGGCIVNMASIAAVVGITDRFAYSMTKGAVLAMTYSVAKDYIQFNIRCNAISPARIHTPFVDGFLAQNYPGHEQEMFEKLSKTQPLGRMGKPEEVAELALFLCSEASAFITGTNIPIDGGFIKLSS